MNRFFSFLIQVLIAVPSGFVVWLITYFGFNTSFILASLIAFIGTLSAYGITAFYLNTRFIKKHGLTRKDYQYIRKNLAEGKRKIARVNKTLLTIRHISSLKQRLELLRLLKRIYTLTRNEPRRFFKAERFYFSHLDSVVELSEKYALLSQQPNKSKQLSLSLDETRRTISDLTSIVEQDLYYILSDDIDDLHFELDVAKHSINKNKKIETFDESRESK